MSLEIGQIENSGTRPVEPQRPAHGSHHPAKTGKSGPSGSKELTDGEKKQVEELKSTDQKVHAHEQAHIAAGGGAVKGGASYQYVTGPDGKRYAVGGEVPIDASPVKGNPQATIQKMQTVIRAALAPADPSGQDRAVAAQASQAMTQAQQEMTKSQNGNGGNDSSAASIKKAGGYDSKGLSTPFQKAGSTLGLLNAFA
jgi:hypothetical protein